MRTVQLDDAPPLSAIGLGTWQFGSREWGYGTAYADREAGLILRRALDLGITLVDTAEAYAFGRSERIVGDAIAGRRSEAVVATKLFPVAPVPPIVQQRARASAKRLGVDRIDLYQVHWPNPVVPVSVTMDPLRQLRDEGVIGHIGVSNFDLGRWRRAEEALGAPVLSNQVSYSLVDRRPEGGLLEWAGRNGRAIIAYSPLAQGLLSGKYDRDHRPTGFVRRANPLFSPDSLERAQPLLRTLREVADAHDATPAQVALAWVIRHPNVVAIPGASSVAQVESNAAAAELDLRDDEAAALTTASDAFEPVRGLAALQSAAEAGLRTGSRVARRLAALAPGPRG